MKIDKLIVKKLIKYLIYISSLFKYIDLYLFNFLS